MTITRRWNSWLTCSSGSSASTALRATRVMLEVHTKGKGVCGVFTFEIAETKVAQVMTYSRQHQHPLLCTMEET